MTKSISLSLAALALWMLPGIAAAQRSGASTYTEDRINQIRQSIADLESRAEQLRRQNQELQQKQDKMRSSYDSRLERLEKGGSAKAPTPRRGRSTP